MSSQTVMMPSSCRRSSPTLAARDTGRASAANNRQMTMAALFSFAYLNQDMQMVLISPQVCVAPHILANLFILWPPWCLANGHHAVLADADGPETCHLTL